MATRPSTPLAAEPASEQAETAAQVLRQFRQVFNAVKSHFQQVERKAGVGGAQVWALSIVAERQGLGVTDLARAMDIHQSTASNLVKGLIERGLLAAEREGPDRRAVQLRVLAAGQRVLKKAPAPFAGVLPGALQRLDRATLKRMNRDLQALIDLLDADERAARVPLAHL